MVTLCLAAIALLLAYGAGLIIGTKHERNEWLSNGAIVFKEKKQLDAKLEVARTELDRYRCLDVVCSCHPKRLNAITCLSIGDDGELKNNTYFEVTLNGSIILQSPYIETALSKYNELCMGFGLLGSHGIAA